MTFVFALIVGKEWLLDEHVAPLWLTVRALGCGSMGALLWAITSGNSKEFEVRLFELNLTSHDTIFCQLSTLGGASLLIVVQQVTMYMVVQRMSAIR